MIRAISPNGMHLLPVIGLMFCMCGCGPRVVISTGTTLGLKATPGDGYTRPPQVTFGYKRAESALVSTAGKQATDTSDAYSTLAAFRFDTTWFGNTELRSFIGTGIAARNVLDEGGAFDAGFAEATNAPVPPSIQEHRVQLNKQRQGLDETDAKKILDLAGLPIIPNKNACSSLHDAILNATTEPQLTQLEKAFKQLDSGDKNVRHPANVKCK